jgi:hypothetical protein
MFEARSVKGAGAADDAVNFVTLGQKQFRQVRTVLTRDAGDKRAFGHKFRPYVWRPDKVTQVKLSQSTCDRNFT